MAVLTGLVRTPTVPAEPTPSVPFGLVPTPESRQ
jgi:hypothetical protein